MSGKEEFVFPYKKIEVWQLAVDLAEYVDVNRFIQTQKPLWGTRSHKNKTKTEIITRKLHGLINSLRKIR